MNCIFFRASLSEKTGFGHYGRSSVLAHLFLMNGWDVAFIFNSNESIPLVPGHSKNLFKYYVIEESSEYLKALNLNRAVKNVLVIDDYRADKRYEEKMREFFSIVVSIDDLNRKHFSHLLIDYYSGTPPEKLLSQNNNQGKILSGHSFAIVKKSFIEKKVHQNLEKRKIKNILINLGSVDEILIRKLINLLDQIELIHNSQLTVLYSKKIENLNFKNFSHFTQIPYSDDLAKLNFDSDFVIGAAGVSMIERIAQRVACLNFICADNQKGSAESFHNGDGLHFFGGDLRTMSEDAIKNCICNSILEYTKGISQNCHCGIDGRGANRIFENICELIEIDKEK